MPISAETPAQWEILGSFQVDLFSVFSALHHAFAGHGNPCYGSVVWLGRFTSASVLAVGLVTAFAGYYGCLRLERLL